MASPNSNVINTVSSLNEVSKKTNTDVMTAINVKVPEYKWFDDLPDEDIIPSGNEMRLVLDVNQQYGGSMIPDGGYEDNMATVPLNHGTLSFVQMNKRYSFTTLAKGYDQKGRAGFIQRQILLQANKAVQAIAFKIGVQTYGFNTGTVAVVKTTGSGGTVQTGIALKNAFGTTLVDGSSTASATYINKLFRNGEGVAIIRSSSLIEFGTVVASPSAASGVGFIDITFNSSITPTVGDLIVYANAVTDTGITGTDTGRWPVGFFDALTSASVEGLATTSAAGWAAGYANTTGGRMSYSTQEAMIDGIANNSGLTMNRVIYSQGVRRDIVAGERAAKRYDNSSDFDWNGEIGTDGIKYYTSQYVPTGMFFGWAKEAYCKKVLSDKPAEDGGPDIFSLDKVQDRGAFAASFDFIYMRPVNSRGALGYASGLTEQ